MLRFMKQRKRATASVSILTAAAVALGVMAFTHPGFTTTDVEMHDGGVWVTKTDTGQLGHLNYQAAELDAGLVVPSENFDVVQNGGHVFVLDRSGMSLNPVDTGQVSLRGDVALPGDVDVTFRGGTLTFLDPLDGRLWASDVQSIGSFDFEEQDPIAVLGPGSAATADEAGNVHAVSAEDAATYRWTLEEGGFALAEEAQRVELGEADRLTITAVGETPVVLDAASGTLFLPRTTTSVPEGAVLQQPSPESDEVLLATGSDLIRQPVSGGDARTEEYAGGGPAVAPVQQADCVHAAWPGDARVIRECADASANIDEMIELGSASDVVFREHRGVVALNDVRAGVSWLMSDQLVMVDNWADLIPPTSDEESEEEDQDSMDDTFDIVAPDPSEENNDPIANDDIIFGARLGRSTLVPVLHNDSDQDGDILTVELVGEAPAGVRISAVRNATQFQVEVPEDFSANAVNFRYRVHDGRGGTDEANVMLGVRDDGQNQAPEELREQRFEVEQRAQYEHAALENWFDPDGDDFFLVDAYSDSGDTVRFNPNGRIVYTATGEPGPTTMTIVVSDGVAETTGTIDVEVRERGTSSPVANADYLRINQGEIASIEPLANDFLPASENARVASAYERGDVTAELERSTNTLYVSSDVIGTHYIDYTVSAGPGQAQGHIRVDVVEPIEDARPVAVRDVALLPMGGEALIDLTENDVDPTGGVLVVQSVETQDAQLSVQLVHRHLLRIEDIHGLTERTTLSYQVSNGTETVEGEIVVIPVEPPESPRNPVATDDSATVREGDYLSVDVTENDFSPDNVPFSVSPELIEHSLLPEEGYVFVDDDAVRVHVVVGGPSYVDVVYEVTDAQGNNDTANLRVNVEPRDLETNDPPRAREITSRVLAGNTVRIPIPLNGIDPDGDGVTLVGWDTAPDRGRIVQVGPDFIDFEAFSTDTGTTTFQYRVRDRWGAESTNMVTVGIAQPGLVNQAPHAAIDFVHVRPDRAVAVSVLDNDTDPDGDELILTGVNTEDAPSEFSSVRVPDDAPTVNFTAPSEPGDFMLEYTIRDVRGATAIGAIQVTVDENAPLIPPQAVDDVVDIQDVELGEPFDVPVLENDRDVDGDPAELTVEVLTGEAVVAGDAVQVIPAEEFQVITYRVTDQDGGQGEAFVFVPGASVRLPYIAADTVLYVDSGVLLEIPLDDVVVMPDGGTARITTEDTVSATNANGDELVVDERNLQYTSAESYVGDAAISFEVTDGSGPNDADAVSAKLSVPIVVRPSSQVPPEFHGIELQVQPAEAATAYDLRSATWDPDDGDVDAMDYELRGGSAPGVNVQIDGQTFNASAEADAQVGTRGVYEIELEDPAGNIESGTVIVEVVASTRPLPRANADSGTTDQGVEISINAIANDFNPFQNVGEPLTVRDARVLQGDAASGPSTDGANVSVTPGQDYSGVLTLQYTIEDATGSDNRTAVGNIEINVRGRPDAPLRPNVGAIGDSQATLSWAAPSANGAPITGYRVQWGGGSQDCPATSCTITGLTNDTVYNFEVTAINEVGESDPSAASIDVRPDVRPERPAAPRAERGDGELSISWETPENRGSAIEYYILEISGPLGQGQPTQVEVEGTSYTWAGLTNGASYEFRVQAHNRADEPSEFSAFSRAVVPAGPPTAPTAGEATLQTVGSAGVRQVLVSWGPAGDNGAAVETYTITPYRGGTALSDSTRTIAAPQNTTTISQAFELPVSTDAYSFRIFATNDVADGEHITTNALRVVNPPGAPSATVTTNHDRSATINVVAGDANGYAAGEITYQYNAGGTWTTIGQGSNGLGSQRISLPGNGQQQVSIRAVGVTDDGVRHESSARGVEGVHPYGPIGNPSASASASAGMVTLDWSAPAANGHPVTVTAQYRIGNSGSWTTINSSRSVEANPGQTVHLRVEATTGRPNNENGAQTTSNSAQATVPQPSITLSRGDVRPGCNSTCYYFVMNWNNMPNGTYNYRCYNTGSDNVNHAFQSGTITINSASGSASRGSNIRNGDGTNHLCFSSYVGDARIELDGNGIDLVTPVRSWP